MLTKMNKKQCPYQITALAKSDTPLDEKVLSTIEQEQKKQKTQLYICQSNDENGMKFLARSLPLSQLIRNNGTSLSGVSSRIIETLMKTDLIREIFRTKANLFIVMELDPEAQLTSVMERMSKEGKSLSGADWDRILLSVAMLFSAMGDKFIHGQIDFNNDVYLLDQSTQNNGDEVISDSFAVRVDFSMSEAIRQLVKKEKTSKKSKKNKDEKKFQLDDISVFANQLVEMAIQQAKKGLIDENYDSARTEALKEIKQICLSKDQCLTWTEVVSVLKEKGQMKQVKIEAIKKFNLTTQQHTQIDSQSHQQLIEKVESGSNNTSSSGEETQLVTKDQDVALKSESPGSCSEKENQDSNQDDADALSESVPELIVSGLNNNSTIRNSGTALISASQIEPNDQQVQEVLAESTVLQETDQNNGYHKLNQNIDCSQKEVVKSVNSAQAAFAKDLRNAMDEDYFKPNGSSEENNSQSDDDNESDWDLLEEEDFEACYELLVSKADVFAQLQNERQTATETNGQFMGRMMSGAIQSLKFW